jgi:hypothetical protein
MRYVLAKGEATFLHSIYNLVLLAFATHLAGGRMKEEALLLARLDKLTSEVQELRERVDRLVVHVRLPEAGGEEREVPLPEEQDVSEDLLTWAGSSTLLPRLSAICFLLVVALALRTVTDHGLLGKLPGALLGIFYASTLIAVGWRKYRHATPLAPVFAGCGAILMYVIIVETQGHFKILPSIPAYLLLMLTGAAMATLSWRFQVALPILIGTLGMCLAGLAIDYPNPIFPLLAILLLIANLLATLATRLKRSSWLRWMVLGMTILMAQVWSVKLAVYLTRHTDPTANHALPWFLPMITLLGAVLLAIAFLGILTSGKHKVSRFDLALPTINAAWVFAAAYYLLAAEKGGLQGFGVTAAAAAAAHFGIAAWLGNARREGAPGTNAFTMAGALLLTLSLPLAFNSHLGTLPLLAVTAVGLAYQAQHWSSGGVRGTSYLLQVTAALALALDMTGGGAEHLTGGGLVVAALMATAALWHFRWCRQNPPPAASLLFSRDEQDRSAVLLLLAALLNTFMAGRVVLYQLLWQGAEGAYAFACGQSVLINIGAALLLLLALRLRNKELRNVAVLVSLVGGAKVFFSDLLATQGFPLVVSVLSFGLLITLVSIILSRWPRGYTASSVQESAVG